MTRPCTTCHRNVTTTKRDGARLQWCPHCQPHLIPRETLEQALQAWGVDCADPIGQHAHTT